MNDAWDRFAASNEGASVASGTVTGSLLWDHIADDETKMLLASFISLARISGKPLARPYRCDSPRERRFMEMSVTMEPGGLLRVDHLILKTEQFKRPVSFVPYRGPGVNPLKRCSMCNRVFVDGIWYDGEEAVGLDHVPLDQPMAVRYGVCPLCQLNPV